MCCSWNPISNSGVTMGGGGGEGERDRMGGGGGGRRGWPSDLAPVEGAARGFNALNIRRVKLTISSALQTHDAHSWNVTTCETAAQ